MRSCAYLPSDVWVHWKVEAPGQLGTTGAFACGASAWLRWALFSGGEASLRGLTGGDGLGALHRDTLAAEPPRTVDGPWGTPNGTVLHTVLRVERWRTATERVSSIHEMRREAVVFEP